MNLDRNTNRGGHGKYALVNMRKIVPTLNALDEYSKDVQRVDKMPSAFDMSILAAFERLVHNGIITLGNETPGDQFFVMKYKDKFTAPALHAYAIQVMAEANGPNGN